MILTAWWFILL